MNLWGHMVAFQSFPRSGNTFLRRYLEQITGVVTGADMNVEHTVPEIMWGLLGQDTVSDDNLVWVTKTHYPLNVFQNEA